MELSLFSSAAKNLLDLVVGPYDNSFWHDDYVEDAFCILYRRLQ